eukprot:3503718-Pyramimonas_sp.AAC.2
MRAPGRASSAPSPEAAPCCKSDWAWAQRQGERPEREGEGENEGLMRIRTSMLVTTMAGMSAMRAVAVTMSEDVV